MENEAMEIEMVGTYTHMEMVVRVTEEVKTCTHMEEVVGFVDVWWWWW